MMSDGERLHRLSASEWYARAMAERVTIEHTPALGVFIAGSEVRVVFVLKDRYAPLRDIVEDFVSFVWPEYHVTEHCLHRHGAIVTVEEGPDNAP